MRVYIALAGLDVSQERQLRTTLAGHRVEFGSKFSSEQSRRAEVGEAEVIFGNPPVAWLAAATKLQWLQLASAGAEDYAGLNRARSESSFVLTNLSDFFGRAVSETALAGLLALYRQVPTLIRAQARREWIQSHVNPRIARLHGSEVIILGAGDIGRRLAALLQPFECRIKLFARSSPAAQMHTLAELDAGLPSADVLINSLPHSGETVGLLDAMRLGRLKKGALFVNVGRGSVVNEEALLAGLNDGRIGGAMLDVTAIEPLPGDSPFWMHPRVVLTQHTGGRFENETDARINFFLENFAQFLRGEKLHGIVLP